MRGETLEPLVYLTSKLRSLEGKLTRAQAKRLVALPAQLGYSSTEEFISAFREAIAAEFVARSNDLDDCSVTDAEPQATVVEDGSEVLPIVTDDTAAATNDRSQAQESREEFSSDEAFSFRAASAEAESSGPSGRTSPEVESEVKRLLEAGKSRAEISRTLGISEAKVRSVKTALGFVQKRKKTGTKAKRASSSSSRKRKGSQR
jgi:DNA-binding NarL/FixJ family response regulator